MKERKICYEENLKSNKVAFQYIRVIQFVILKQINMCFVKFYELIYLYVLIFTCLYNILEKIQNQLKKYIHKSIDKV